jgi:hypothetical protein
MPLTLLRSPFSFSQTCAAATSMMLHHAHVRTHMHKQDLVLAACMLANSLPGHTFSEEKVSAVQQVYC